jgi:hypothetical protein
MTFCASVRRLRRLLYSSRFFLHAVLYSRGTLQLTRLPKVKACPACGCFIGQSQAFVFLAHRQIASKTVMARGVKRGISIEINV